MLFWAVDEGLISTNPLSRVRMTRERKKPRFVISVAEEDLLLQSAAPHLAAIIIAALDSGMRRGEILTQRWEHIDFNRQILSVTHSKTPEGEAREIPLTIRLGWSIGWRGRFEQAVVDSSSKCNELHIRRGVSFLELGLSQKSLV
jgi:integrase